MSFYNERQNVKVFDRDKMLNPIYKVKVEKVVKDIKNKGKKMKKQEIELEAKYKPSIEFQKVGTVNKELDINIPLSLNFQDVYKIIDLLELDDIINHLIENYDINVIEKKLNEIKELDNE